MTQCVTSKGLKKQSFRSFKFMYAVNCYKNSMVNVQCALINGKICRFLSGVIPKKYFYMKLFMFRMKHYIFK